MNSLLKAMATFSCGATIALGQPSTPLSKQFLEVKHYSQAEDDRIVKLYDGIRTVDVMDALDVVGLQDITMMDRDIRPLWKDEQNISHRIHGVALTLRLVPAQVRAPRFASHADERPWEANWYKPQGEYVPLVRPGTILVVDNQSKDDGWCGSNMGLTLFGKGLRGFVGNEVCRDVDELSLTRIPVYQNPLLAPRGINPGRTWLESYNQPITVGHVLVMPGDIIVADGDGVAVVPRARAEEVGGIARWIFEDDEWKRGKIYDNVKRPRDWTVKGHDEQPPASSKPIK
jgi:4-hydroxy-4-methyl-2-oxoglutarate aldolase